MQRPSIEAPENLTAWRFDVEGDAFALLEWPSAPPQLPARFRFLTRAEAAVATLAAVGHSNPEIARERRCSTRTVANQIARAFQKLLVHSRAELVAASVSRGRVGRQ